MVCRRFRAGWTEYPLPPEWKDHPKVEIIRESLDSAGYQKRLDEADVLLLPYRRSQYHARLSGIAIESFQSGVPCICVSDTWVEDCMKEIGGGIAIANEAQRDLSEAILAVSEDRDFSIPVERCVQARARHSPSRFLIFFSQPVIRDHWAQSVVPRRSDRSQSTICRSACCSTSDSIGMSNPGDPSILIFSPASVGGVAEHTCYQGRALKSSGVAVLGLVADGFLAGRPLAFETLPVLLPPPSGAPGIWRKLKLAFQIVANFWILAGQVWQRRPSLVLLDSYVEYLAPFWIWPHWFLARFAGFNMRRIFTTRSGTIRWSRLVHGWSVRLAYLPLKFVLVHDALPEPSPVAVRNRRRRGTGRSLRTRRDADGRGVAPPGLGCETRAEGFLAFGFVRDNKNLDLAVRALAEVSRRVSRHRRSVASSHDRPFLSTTRSRRNREFLSDAIFPKASSMMNNSARCSREPTTSC